ncbi:MAG: hypothetical protein A3G41_08180 [Elusimicrobia bacterium RIFCSPLOWO2_12_FULL_59_9]|nr:MAG: hypothetical protein A3G41_08180 [Elusimicrobia bacterium RIFCSPLOWO2_12_FULL_59_9]
MRYTSPYQLAKLWLVALLRLSKDAIHIYVGAACLLLAITLFRCPLRSWRALLPGLLLSIFMESMDLWDDVHSLGHLRWTASLHDVLNTNFLPFVIVNLARWKKTEL